MNRNVKKFLASFLIALTVISVAPMGEIAKLNFDWLKNIDFSWLDFGVKSNALESSGNCGANVNYIFDSSTGTLTISGTGKMYDFVWDYSPFYENLSIKEVIIESGITTIGENAFYKCTGLTSIVIPDSVKSIGKYAFERCTGLTSITIPDSVTSIGDNAFYYCTGLTDATIGNSVTSIEERVFYGCTKLTSIVIPDSVKSIEEYAFYDTGYYNNSSNWENGVLYIGNHLIKADESILGSYTIKSGTKTIAVWAFSDCTGLTGITIPDSVTNIGREAFEDTGYYNNSSNWEDGVLYIGNHLIEAKESVFGSYSIKSGTKTIADYAFENCTGLTSITIPNSVTNIGNFAFDSCRGLTSISIPDSVISMGDWVFDNCVELTGITFPNGIKNIREGTFARCSSLTSITIPDSVTSIGDNAFYYSGLTDITIPDSVTSIGEEAFYYCSGLTSITIPKSVLSIGWDCFVFCDNLTDIYYLDTEEHWNKINAGYDHNYLSKATVHFDEPQGNPCGENVYYKFDSSTGTMTISGTGEMYNYEEYYYDYSPFYNNPSIKKVIIESGVTSIGMEAFYYCTGLTSVTIPESVTNIRNRAFEGCTGLISITVPDSVISIGQDVFKNTGYYNNSSNWENGVLYIGNHLIKAKESISGSYSIKSGTKTIAFFAFDRCEDLTNITIPNSVTSIGDEAFYDCTGLTSITIPNSVTSIGEWAFADCTGLTSVTIPDSVTNIGEKAFLGCHKLKSITIPDSITNIEFGVFWYCTELTSITIPNSVTNIGDYAFYLCYELTDVYYSGTEEQWNKINIGSDNDDLTKATVHYSDIQSAITDKDTGISIECSDEFEEGTVIEVSEITDGKSVQIISEKFGETKSKIFDITPLKDGVKVQPDGKVTVKIPIPEGFNSEKLIVVYIDSVNGTTQNLPTKIVGKFIEFETDHFSHYAVVEVKGKVSSVQVSDVTVNKNKSTTINPNIKADTGVNYTVTYTSSNESVATVDNNGNVKGLKRGSATITCTVTDEYGNTVSDTCTVNVKYSFGQWLIVIFLFGWIWY